MAVLIIAFDDTLSFLPSNIKPFAGVGQIFVFDGQVFSQNAFAVWQSIGVRAEQPVVFVLVPVVTVAGSEYVVVELDHGYDAGVQQIFGIGNFGFRVFPNPRQHIGAVHGHVCHHSKTILKPKRIRYVRHGMIILRRSRGITPRKINIYISYPLEMKLSAYILMYPENSESSLSKC